MLGSTKHSVALCVLVLAEKSDVEDLDVKALSVLIEAFDKVNPENFIVIYNMH